MKSAWRLVGLILCTLAGLFVAPVLFPVTVFRFVQTRRWASRFLASDSARLSLEAHNLCWTTRDGSVERVPLADVRRIVVTTVDWDGSFAAANECDVFVCIQRLDGSRSAIALSPEEMSARLRAMLRVSAGAVDERFFQGVGGQQLVLRALVTAGAILVLVLCLR